MLFVSAGVAAAFVAMLCWGIGDFLIQRSERRRGTWETLFFINVFGMVVLFPFVYAKLPTVFMSGATTRVLLASAAVFFVAGFIQFEAFRLGKLSVMEPLQSLEIPLTALLAFLILGESLSLMQYTLIAVLIVALVTVSYKKKTFLGFLFERGAMLGAVAALFSGGASFLMGWSGRLTDPFVAVFCVSVFTAATSGFFLVISGRMKATIHDVLKNYRAILPMAVLDTVAWIAFVTAMTLAPIGVAIALTESYIVIAVMLGLTKNHEHLMLHQKVGLVIALVCAVWLAMITA